MKCCKEHKEKCPALIKNNNVKNSAESQSNNDHDDEIKSQPSKYLPSDELTADPIENAMRRRKMIDDGDSDDDSIEEDEWRISKEMMDRLDSSAWLRKELTDGGLRQVIAAIDNANWDDQKHEKKKRKHFSIDQTRELTPREAALERAKHSNPKFAKFVDKLLLTVGVLVDNGKADDDIAALLNNDIDSSNLTLALLPSKRKLNQLKEDDNTTTDSDSGSGSESDVESD